MPFRCGVGTVVTKNCEPLVFGPALAIDNRPGSVTTFIPHVTLSTTETIMEMNFNHELPTYDRE